MFVGLSCLRRQNPSPPTANKSLANRKNKNQNPPRSLASTCSPGGRHSHRIERQTRLIYSIPLAWIQLPFPVDKTDAPPRLANPSGGGRGRRRRRLQRVRVGSAAMPWLEMWLPPAAGEGAVAAGLFLDGGDAAAHGALLAAMPGCSVSFGARSRRRRGAPPGFLSVTMSVKGGSGFVPGSVGLLAGAEKGGAEEAEALVAGNKAVEEVAVAEGKVLVLQCTEKEKDARAGAGAMNMTKHLWAGAVAAMVSRTIVAPLERLKLEYIVRGEQRNLFELMHAIATTQGLKGFWKGNFVNILRTAPFKAVNFYAYDTYRKQLHKWSGNEETTNLERFIAGAFAGVTATLMCIPMDTIRTRMVAPGGEALGGVIGVARHMIQTEGFFSLYKGLVPSLISMAPSGAVFYGVYDILKMAYLHSPEGKKRVSMKQQKQEANALDQLELGTARTLLYGAIAGCCAEAATYPFEVVRRQLQMQVKATRMNAFATCLKIVDQGGVPALYAGLIPSLLQVLPSASISYFVYELMKIVLKVE